MTIRMQAASGSQEFRLCYKCPNCAELHIIYGTLPELLQLADALMRPGDKSLEPIRTVLLQESTAAIIAEMDLAEEEAEKPGTVQKLARNLKGWG